MKKTVVAAAIAAFAAAGAASAAPIKVTYQSPGVFGAGSLYKDVKIHSSVIQNSTNSASVRAGLFHLTGDNGVGDFVAFCVDIAQNLNNPQYMVENASLLSSGVVANIDKLFSSILGSSTLASVIDTKLEAAGMQLALWEIVFETGGTFDVNSGSFYESKSSAVRAQATDYLDLLATAPMGLQDLTFYESSKNQDLVTGTPAPVPVPASGLLAGSGLIALFAARRRRKAA